MLFETVLDYLVLVSKTYYTNALALFGILKTKTKSLRLSGPNSVEASINLVTFYKDSYSIYCTYSILI